MEQETSTDTRGERTRDRARHTAAVLCLVAGIVHLISGRPALMAFGFGYWVTAIALFRGWRQARSVAITIATLRAVGALVLIGLEVPELLAGSVTPEMRTEAGLNLYWVVVNAAILWLMFRGPRPATTS